MVAILSSFLAAMVLGLGLGVVGGSIYIMWQDRVTARETNTQNQGSNIELETIARGQAQDD